MLKDVLEYNPSCTVRSSVLDSYDKFKSCAANVYTLGPIDNDAVIMRASMRNLREKLDVAYI